MEPAVRNNEAKNRYELVVDDCVAGIADYHEDGNVVVFPHTEVLPQLRGRGLGGVLVRGALDDVRRANALVRPSCSFVRDFIEHNEEYADLLAS